MISLSINQPGATLTLKLRHLKTNHFQPLLAIIRRTNCHLQAINQFQKYHKWCLHLHPLTNQYRVLKKQLKSHLLNSSSIHSFKVSIQRQQFSNQWTIMLWSRHWQTPGIQTLERATKSYRATTTHSHQTRKTKSLSHFIKTSLSTLFFRETWITPMCLDQAIRQTYGLRSKA